MGKNVVIFGADKSLSVHIENKGIDTLSLGKGLTQELDDTTLTAKYPFTQPIIRFVLSLHYNRSNSFLFVNTTIIHQFKAKNSETEDYVLCLGKNRKKQDMKKQY